MRVAALLFMLVAGPLWGSGAGGEPVRVAVAANFKPTLQQITRQYSAMTGRSVTLSSASTGVLASQIIHGAPFDLFFAADRETPMLLQASSPEQNLHSFCYARGSLALTGGDGSLAVLAQPELSLAIANPATAPYGRAAMQVLSRDEFQAGTARKLVRGNNVTQAYQFWHSGAVDLALLPRAIAPADATLIPLAWHRALEQYAVVLKPGAEVNAFVDWIDSAAVRTLITQAGYEPCP